MPEDILCFSAWNMSLELQTLWKYKLKFFPLVVCGLQLKQHLLRKKLLMLKHYHLFETSFLGYI